jgi:hypothetical protein
VREREMARPMGREADGGREGRERASENLWSRFRIVHEKYEVDLIPDRFRSFFLVYTERERKRETSGRFPEIPLQE